MNQRDAFKSIIKKIILSEISSDTMRAAAEKARSVGKHRQANRFHDAADKKSGLDKKSELEKALAGAPKEIEVFIEGLSFMGRLTKTTLTGLYRRDDSIFIEYVGGGVFGLGKLVGEIIVTKDGKFYLNADDDGVYNIKFDRAGVIAMHKITGIPNANIPKIDKLTEDRETIKNLVRGILSEITKADYGVGNAFTKEDAEKELQKAVKSAGGEMIDNPLNNKFASDDKQNGKKFQIDLYEQGEDCYDVTAIYNGSDRQVAKGLKLKDAIEFVKKGLDSAKESYVEKARNKSVNATDKKVDEKKSKKDEEKKEDETTEVKEKTQAEIADKNDKKAEEKVDEKKSAISDEIAPQLGGEIVDKIDKIIDRVLKNKTKADAKTPFLKTDSDMESPDKLVVKDKGTPELKEKKK